MRKGHRNTILSSVLLAALLGGSGYAQIILPPSGNINTVVGNGTAGYSGDGGPAVDAKINSPGQIALGGVAGDLYIADTGNNVIRKVSASTGIITTVAGNGIAGGSGDGGPAVNAELYAPGGVAVDFRGNIYIADSGNGRIREVNASTGIISTIAGGAPCCGGDNILAIDAQFYLPEWVQVDFHGNIYFATPDSGSIREVTAATGIISTPLSGVDAGAFVFAPSRNLNGGDSLYISSDNMNAPYILLWPTSIGVSVVAGDGTPGYTGDGGPAVNAEVNPSTGIAADSQSNIYFSIYDSSVQPYGASAIRKVTGSTGDISTIAGGDTAGYSGDGGLAANAVLNFPEGVVLNSVKNVLYFVDAGNNRIRAIGL